jgi:hypothetical protein
VSKRCKKLVVTLAVLATAALIAVAAHPIREAVCFASLSPTEKKVVREWKAYTICGIVRTTYRSDHTWTATGPDDGTGRPLRGHWRVQGDDIVSEVDAGQFEVLAPPPPRQFPIAELSEMDGIARAIPEQGRK